VLDSYLIASPIKHIEQTGTKATELSDDSDEKLASFFSHYSKEDE
jgi:hypothetical protein